MEPEKIVRPDWSRDETVLALHLYLEHWPIKNETDARIAELSKFLREAQPQYSENDPKFRNPAGVYRKLTNLLSVDPSKSSIGSPHASEMDRAVFEEFGGDYSRLAAAAAEARFRLASTGGANLLTITDRRIWITGMWGFDPATWGFLGFSDLRTREKFLTEYDPADLVLVVGQNSEMAEQSDVGRLLGFLRITKTKIFDYERMPSDEYERKLQLYGKDRWSFAMPANAAWRIGTEVRVKHVLPETYSGRWPQQIGARYREVLPEEVSNLQNLRLIPWHVFGEDGWNESLGERPSAGLLKSLVTKGPVPRFGSYVGEFKNSVSWVYIFELAGTAHSLFDAPDKRPLGARKIYKIGWCTNVENRLNDLNAGFPEGLHIRWRRYDMRAFGDRESAYRIEQDIFDWVRTKNISLGGEFIICDFKTMASIQANWFSSNAGKISASQSPAAR